MATAQPSLEVGETNYPTEMRIEQRESPRFKLLLRQAKLRTKDAEFLCVVRDLSERGISVRTFHALPEGDRFAVEIRDGHPYPIEKIWEEEGAAGFRFKNPVALQEVLEEDARYPRRQLRVNLELPVTLRSGSEFGHGTCTNLSQQGARMECDRIWARGQLLHVKADALPELHAKVRWRRDLTHGLVFEETTSFRDFACLLAQLQGID